MPGWVERWQKRRRELAEGADADLIQSNRRRFRVAFGLIGLAFVLGLIDAKFHFPAMLEVAIRVLQRDSGTCARSSRAVKSRCASGTRTNH